MNLMELLNNNNIIINIYSDSDVLVTFVGGILNF